MIEHEYAFDVKLSAVVRLRAMSEEHAVRPLKDVLDAANLDLAASKCGSNPIVADASIEVDDVDYPYLFEVDGKDIHDLD